jgi:O-antigen ligase
VSTPAHFIGPRSPWIEADASPPSEPAHRVHWILLVVGLSGPAIGAFGLYGANVLLILAAPMLVLLRRQWRLVPESAALLVLAAALLGYILIWAVASGGAPWAWIHLAIMFLSGTAFLAHVVVASFPGSAHKMLPWLCGFTWFTLGFAVLEALTGWRLPVSRYSSVAPQLGYAYEGHDGPSLLVDGLWVPTGLFANQNNLAFAILCLLPFALAAHRRTWARAALVGVAFTVILLSESRTGLVVGLCWAVAVLAVRVLSRRNALAALLLLSGAGLIWGWGSDAIDYICADSEHKACFAIAVAQNLSVSDLELAQDSIGVRFQLAEQSWHLWTQSPLFGVGPGQLGSLISAMHSEGMVITDAHNALLQILAEYGLVGSAIWLAAGAVMLRALIRMPVHDEATLRFRRASLTFMMLAPLASVTVSTMYYFVPIWVLSGAVLGVALGERRGTHA